MKKLPDVWPRQQEVIGLEADQQIVTRLQVWCSGLYCGCGPERLCLVTSISRAISIPQPPLLLLEVISQMSVIQIALLNMADTIMTKAFRSMVPGNERWVGLLSSSL